MNNFRLMSLAACFLVMLQLPVTQAHEAKFKLAIVQGELGTEDLLAGNTQASISKLERKKKWQNTYNSMMGLCVAYIKENRPVRSEAACTLAISRANSIPSNYSDASYLKSLSYSNRGVSRYQNNDLSGALQDLNAAVQIDSNRLTKNNLALAEKHSIEARASINITNSTSISAE